MSTKPVIAAVDGSPESTRAAAFAWRLAAAAHAPCRLVHVVSDVWLTDYLGVPPPSPRLLDDVLAIQRRRITESLDGVVPAAVVEGLDVRYGRTEQELARLAERAGAQFVVVGGKHHAALGRTLGGSTAQHLVRTLDRPLLVVGTSPPARRVLAAVDLSPAARPTLALARRVATLLKAELRIVHAVEPVRLPLTIGLAADQDDVYRRSVKAFERLGGAGAERVVRRGEAIDTLITEVRDWRADLLVVGSHGRGWVDRLLIGSVTERLLGALPTSLLVVPAGARRVVRRPARARRQAWIGSGVTV